MLDLPPSLIIEHTLLGPTTQREKILQVCEEAVEYGFAAVCIPPVYVSQAAEQLRGSEVQVCTVVGFPTGFECTSTKVYAAQRALRAGADEIDMVVQQGWIQDERYADIEAEIHQVKQSCGSATLKVIIECCNLNATQKRLVAQRVADAGADYVKTSSGTASGGASVADVELLCDAVGQRIKIKAAGGIRTLEQLEDMYHAGATRIGTSCAIDIVAQWLKG
jgi:deoxyribose-phosphate aldolase